MQKMVTIPKLRVLLLACSDILPKKQIKRKKITFIAKLYSVIRTSLSANN